MPRHGALVRIARFLITVVSLLFQPHLIAAEDPADLFNEEPFTDLPLNNPVIHQMPLSSPENLQLSSEEVNDPRLLDLLRLKLSMIGYLSPIPGIEGQDYDTQDQQDKSKFAKRVFCNGFTGCGGRFRGRRRQQQPVAEIGKRLLPSSRKRPFCNSYGCYNSGKKRFSQVSAQSDAPLMAALTDDWLEEKIKRLFCNGYGGCQNGGKRLITLGAGDGKAVSDELRAPLPIFKALLEKLGSLKQVSTSEVDEDSLINSVRR